MPSIEQFLRNELGLLLGVPAEDVDVHKPLSRYGVDSAVTIQLTERLGQVLGRELPPTLFYDHETIAAVAEHLSPAPSQSAAG